MKYYPYFVEKKRVFSITIYMVATGQPPIREKREMREKLGIRDFDCQCEKHAVHYFVCHVTHIPTHTYMHTHTKTMRLGSTGIG